MTSTKIKTVIFLIVFLLTLAVVCNLLIDLSENKRVAEVTADVPTADPYADENSTGGSSGTVVVITPPPAVSGNTSGSSNNSVNNPAPTMRPIETAAPTPEPTVEPTPEPTPEVTPVPIPVNTVFADGIFKSDTGALIDIMADWNAVVIDNETVKVTVNVNLSSYTLYLMESFNGVQVSVGDSYKSSSTPAVTHEDNTLLITPLATTEHYIKLSAGNTATYPVQVVYNFGGTYHQVDLPTIECGGYITLAR